MYHFDENSLNHIPPEEFGKRLASFMTEFGVSVRRLAAICGNQKLLSPSSIYRLKSGTIGEDLYRQILPMMEERLEEWMHDQKWDALEIENLLDRLFPQRKDRTMNINRCILPSDAIKFFGLKDDPFDVDRVPGDDEMFTDKQLDEIAARAKDAVLYKKFACISGGVGTGKTSMKIRIARELAEGKQRVHLLYPEFFDMNALSVSAIASYILEEFQVKPPRDAARRVRKIKEILTSLEKDDARIALVFDECHRLNEKVLSSLKNFWEMTNGGYARLLGIVLFGQPKFVEATLRETQFREIAERVDVIEMPSIEKSAREYLAHKIQAVGGDIDELFDARAVARICSVAKTPLSLGNLANSALMEAYKIEEKQVASQMLNLPDAPKVRALRAA